MPKIIFQPLMICNPPSKNVLTYLGFADLQSAAGKNAVAGLGITTPRLPLKKDGIFTFSVF